MMNPPKMTTDDLVKFWLEAQQRLDEARREVGRAETELANRTNSLGARLVPKDAPLAEKFSVWVGDKLLTVVREAHNTYKVVARRHPQD